VLDDEFSYRSPHALWGRNSLKDDQTFISSKYCSIGIKRQNINVRDCLALGGLDGCVHGQAPDNRLLSET